MRSNNADAGSTVAAMQPSAAVSTMLPAAGARLTTTEHETPGQIPKLDPSDGCHDVLT